MKKIGVELRITNLTDNISATQLKEGDIPVLNNGIKKFELEGVDHPEQIKKLFINVLACYATAYDGKFDVAKYYKSFDGLVRWFEGEKHE